MALIDYVFSMLRTVERGTAYLQGKGYGASSIKMEIDLALSLVGRSPNLAIDIGGNVGKYTLELRRRSPECEVQIFEPAATNISVLQERLGADQKIHIVPMAVSDAAQENMLYANEPGSGLGSLAKRRLDHFGITMDHEEHVKTIRFDDYYNKNLIGREIDLVKIDIEGFELAALRGFGEAALQKTRCVQFEFGGGMIDTRTYFQDFFYFFSKNEFDLFRITPVGLQQIPHYSESDEFFSTVNYLARNRKLA